MLDILIEPKDCALVLVDQQAGLAFGVGSIDRQMLLNNVIALARTATVFGMPIVASTSATKVYSGPLMPAIHAAIPEVVAIDRRDMNMWEDDAAQRDRGDRTAEADLFGAVDGSVRETTGNEFTLHPSPVGTAGRPAIDQFKFRLYHSQLSSSPRTSSQIFGHSDQLPVSGASNRTPQTM